jgi:hypothetical protein
MLLGDDVIDVESGEGQRRLRQPAVLAAIARPFSDQRSQRFIHQIGWLLAKA